MQKSLPQASISASAVSPHNIRRTKPVLIASQGGPLRIAHGGFINNAKRRPTLYAVHPTPLKRRKVTTQLSSSSSSSPMPASIKMTKFDVRSIDTFCHSIGSQLKDLPDKAATELVTEIQNLVWNRTMLLRNAQRVQPAVNVNPIMSKAVGPSSTNASKKTASEWLNCPIKVRFV